MRVCECVIQCIVLRNAVVLNGRSNGIQLRTINLRLYFRPFSQNSRSCGCLQHSTRIFIRNVQRKPTYLHLPIEGNTNGGREWMVFSHFFFFSNGQSLITSMKFRGLYRDNSIFCALLYVADRDTLRVGYAYAYIHACKINDWYY